MKTMLFIVIEPIGWDMFVIVFQQNKEISVDGVLCVGVFFLLLLLLLLFLTCGFGMSGDGRLASDFGDGRKKCCPKRLHKHHQSVSFFVMQIEH